MKQFNPALAYCSLRYRTLQLRLRLRALTAKPFEIFVVWEYTQVMGAFPTIQMFDSRTPLHTRSHMNSHIHAPASACVCEPVCMPVCVRAQFRVSGRVVAVRVNTASIYPPRNPDRSIRLP